MDLSILNYISYDSDGKTKAWKAVIEGIKPNTLDFGKQIGVDHKKKNVDEKSSIEILWRDILIYDYCKKIVMRVRDLEFGGITMKDNHFHSGYIGSVMNGVRIDLEDTAMVIWKRILLLFWMLPFIPNRDNGHRVESNWE